MTPIVTIVRTVRNTRNRRIGPASASDSSWPAASVSSFVGACVGCDMSVPVSPVLERFGEIRLAERQQASGLQLPEENGDPDAADGDRRHGVEPVQVQDR